ncbi:hypothetical protein EWB00_002474 [Schistosoma japonicum]|uniref:Uncharacterized protein n=1 Tax=Schistosoma japonicum TaxID=6182 RepID=A0A4Z2DBQ0_SCHJA|nr:hypothetical protein EWB00_002474 [Schistosoma japonicum]TNN13894.1 hypothetical protein EWB00_002474 [Schistosoma japonicum]
MLYRNIDINGAKAAGILKRRNSNSVKTTLFIAVLRLLLSNCLLFNSNLKNKMLPLTTSMCTDHFTCSCRDLLMRIRKHHTVWLRGDASGTMKSSIIQHHINIDHSIKTVSLHLH